MGSSLTSALGNAGNALDVIQSALSVIQANVSNSSTPGYATQQVNLETAPLDSVSGMGGGVLNGGVQSSRDSYADTAVEQQLQALGLYTAQTQATGTLQNFFDVTGATGVSADLNNLFTSFSNWSASPNVASAQQNVLSAASAVASSISGLASSLQNASVQLGHQVSSTVSQINAITAQIKQYNIERQSSGQTDPGAQAQLQNNLETLSNLVNFTALTQADGTITVLAGNGAPLVMGDQQFALGSNQTVINVPPAANPQSPPTSQILDAQGNDITGSITGGQLGGLLDTQNRVLAGIIGDSQNAGSLNILAKSLADTVNTIMTSGTVSTAPAAPNGINLFAYSAADATDAAASLQVNPAMTLAQLAPVDAAGNANGNASALAALANASGPVGTINGMTFTGYFANVAAGVGAENQNAQSKQQAQQSIATQAQTLRDSISGVSVNAQAALLLQFQHAYQAVSQVLQVVNQMATDILQIVPQQ
jgi:flagellar hook-associated protein 1 FlgK